PQPRFPFDSENGERYTPSRFEIIKMFFIGALQANSRLPSTSLRQLSRLDARSNASDVGRTLLGKVNIAAGGASAERIDRRDLGQRPGRNQDSGCRQQQHKQCSPRREAHVFHLTLLLRLAETSSLTAKAARIIRLS